MKSLLTLTLSLFFLTPTGHAKITTDFPDEMVVEFLLDSPEFKSYKREYKDLFKKARYVGADITRTIMTDGLPSYEVNLQFKTEVTYRGKKHKVFMSVMASTQIERFVVPGRRIVASKLADPTFQKPSLPAL